MKRNIILTSLSQLKNTLTQIIKLLTAKENESGVLRIEIRKNTIRYFHRKDSEDKHGTFIKKKDIDTAKKLAQKEYETKVIKAAEKSSAAINKCIELLNNCTFPDEVYDQLSSERKALVTKIDSDEEYVEEWKTKHKYPESYFRKGTPVYITDNGERVRSKTEHMMANCFKSRGIVYVYEPVVITNKTTRRPDFLVLNTRTRQEYYVEHLGMMEDPQYVKENMDKLREYEETGIIQGKNLILVFSDLEHPVDSTMIDRLIDNFFV